MKCRVYYLHLVIPTKFIYIKRKVVESNEFINFFLKDEILVSCNEKQFLLLIVNFLTLECITIIIKFYLRIEGDYQVIRTSTFL